MVRTKYPISAAFAALVFAGPLSAQQAVTSVTLAEALRRAQVVAPIVVSAEGAIRSAQLSTRTAVWSLIPALTVVPRADLQLANGQSRLDPVTGQVTSAGENTTIPSVQLGMSANYTIFDGFGRNYTLKQRRAQEAGADASLTVAQLSSDFATTQAFFNALSSRQQLVVAQSALDAAQGQLTLASAKLRAGSGQISDSLSALGSYLQARLGVLTAQNTVVVNETNLGRLIGIAGRAAATDDSAYYRPATQIDTAATRQDAMTQAPVILSADASLLASQQAYRATKATYLPTLSATANSNWTAAKPGYAVVPRRSLGLTLQWSPWTSYARETQVENASIQVINNEAALADTRNSIAAQLNQQFAALANAQETINVTAAQRIAGEENLRAVTERYRIGLATITDLLSAQQAAVSAAANQVSARFSYLIAKATLEQILGRKL